MEQEVYILTSDHPTFLFLAFVVFNPGDLYYLGYKIIIIATTMFMVLSS